MIPASLPFEYLQYIDRHDRVRLPASSDGQLRAHRHVTRVGRLIDRRLKGMPKGALPVTL
jgi:hypothetical protein